MSISFGKLRHAWTGPSTAASAMSVPSVAAPTVCLRPRLSQLAAIVLVAATTLPLKRWGDYDIFWHLSNGRLMERDGVFPSPDRFSWSAAGGEVNLNSVQAERLLYLLWRLNGGVALAGFSALLFVGALLPFALLIGRLRLQPWVDATAIVLLAIALLPYAGARPHMFGVALLGILAIQMERPFGYRKGLTAGLVLGLWVNLHGSFLFGFVLVAAAAVAWFHLRDRRAAMAAGVALVIGGGATLLSPFGFELWRMPFHVSSHPLLPLVNKDWFGLRPMSSEGAITGVLILAAAALGIWRGSDPKALTALALVLPAIQYQRFAIFAAPLLLIAVLERLTVKLPSLTIAPASKLGLATSRRGMEAIAWAFLITGALVVLSTAPTTGMEGTARRPLPEAAVDRLLACGAPAPVWNDYNWGGYLLWRGEGRYTVGIDGRAETLYPVPVFVNYLTVAQGRTGWQEILQASPAQYILVPDDGSITLRGLPGWQGVYADGTAIIGRRNGADWTCPVQVD